MNNVLKTYFTYRFYAGCAHRWQHCASHTLLRTMVISGKIPAPLKIASKRVCENLFTHKASRSNFNKVNFTAWTCSIFGSSDRKILANERAETCLHAQRVQQNLQEVNVRPLVRRSLSEWLTEEVPHHPKIKQTVQVATPFRLRDVARNSWTKKRWTESPVCRNLLVLFSYEKNI